MMPFYIVIALIPPFLALFGLLSTEYTQVSFKKIVMELFTSYTQFIYLFDHKKRSEMINILNGEIIPENFEKKQIMHSMLIWVLIILFFICVSIK